MRSKSQFARLSGLEASRSPQATESSYVSSSLYDSPIASPDEPNKHRSRDETYHDFDEQMFMHSRDLMTAPGLESRTDSIVVLEDKDQ